MSSDVISSLQLDKELTSSKLIVAKEISGCDSSFITSCILGHCIKNKNAILVISTHNSKQHYQNVGLKMNYNLQRYIDSGIIQFYNLGEEIVNNLMENKGSDVQELVLSVTEKITLMKERYHSVNIIFDGISHLFDLQYSLRDVNYFCREIIKIVREQNNSFLLCHCHVAHEDDVSYVLANLLSHMAQTVVEVESLSSGWSADVSGHLTIRHPDKKFEDEHMYTLDLRPQRFLFKLFDRGVKLFAPGTV